MGDHIFIVFEILLLKMFRLGRRTARSVMVSDLGAWSGAGALFSWLARRVRGSFSDLRPRRGSGGHKTS
jgi:hypothetical protein